jgi:cell division protein FtsL
VKCIGLEEKLRDKENECVQIRNELNDALKRERIMKEGNDGLKRIWKGKYTLLVI